MVEGIRGQEAGLSESQKTDTEAKSQACLLSSGTPRSSLPGQCQKGGQPSGGGHAAT